MSYFEPYDTIGAATTQYGSSMESEHDSVVWVATI
jgi:hypothetical protein